MSKTRFLLNGFFILTLVISALGAVSISAGAARSDELKADPRLLQMAAENPDAAFMVIVQKDAKNRDLKDMEIEGEVLNGGGQVKQDLDMIVSFSAEMTGSEILRLAKHKKVRWISADAPMASADTPGMETMRDEFTTLSYSGSNGAVNWSSNWLESGETTSPTAGVIQVVSNSACAGGYCLRLDPASTGKAVYRSANLSGFVSVWLSFNRNNLLNASGGSSEQVQLQVSANGSSWTTLQTYSSTQNTGAAADSFDISAYATSTTQVRFLISQYQTGTRYVYFDNVEIIYARASAYLSAVKADTALATGSGISVAVIDSGLTTLHPDFITNNSSRVLVSNVFGRSFIAEDVYGHGTHVAGIIGGNGSASAGRYRGIAPGVNLINLKVTDDYGMTYESDVVNAMQWVYNNRTAYNIRVVNLSLNSTVAQSYNTSPLDAAAEILWFNGVVVVVSSGNNGTADAPAAIYPPANDPFVITVGAAEDKGTASLMDDTMAAFSAYGTTEDGFAKPDLVAPGRNVVAPLGGIINTVFQLHPLNRVDNYYFRMSGTSMSAPIVSGAAALLLQANPALTPDQVKYRLAYTASTSWTAYNVSRAGAGYLDISAALKNNSSKSANAGIPVSSMLTSDGTPVTWTNVGWNTVGWNTVGWNTVGWNTVGWNTVGWNTVGWNTSLWDTK